MAMKDKAIAAEKKFFMQPANFAHVVYLAVFALVAVLIAAAIIVTWRAKQVKKGPFTKHPTAQILLPERLSTIANWG